MKLYQIGLKNLKRRKLRTSLLMFGLGLAVAIEVALTGLTKSLETDFSKKLDEFGVKPADNIEINNTAFKVSGELTETGSQDDTGSFSHLASMSRECNRRAHAASWRVNKQKK